MGTLVHDVRYGWRMLYKRPGFTLLAALTLALGIGANTAIFSVVNAVMLRPLPFPQSERLASVYHAYSKLNLAHVTVSPLGLRYYNEHVKSFSGIAGFSGWRAPQNLTGNGAPERVRSVLVTGDLFGVLGVRPAMGRGFLAEEQQPGKDRVAVVSYGLWQQRLGGDPAIVNKTIRLDGESYTVVGVMPRGFQFPSEAELWVSLGLTPEQWNEGAEYLNVVGRLRDGVSHEQAQAELATVSQNVVRDFFRGDNSAGWSVGSMPLREFTLGDWKQPVLVLLGAVACVLLIACVNVANLMLARAAERQKEVAIRSAMGATRWRMIRQMLTEGILLAMLGGIVGLFIGYWGVDALLALVPVQIPTWLQVGVDRNVLLFTFALAIGTGLLFGSVPAFQFSSVAMNDSLKEGGRTSAISGHNRLRAVLVMVEMAFAVVLLVSAGLMIKSFMRLQQRDLGFRADRTLVFDVNLPAERYKEDAKVVGFYRELLERLKTLPGVKAAAATSALPLTSNWMSSFSIEGKELSPRPHSHFGVASPELLQVMGIPLVRGRWFDSSDRADSKLVAVIDERVARTYFPNEDPVGKLIRSSGGGKPEAREIVGVVGAVRKVEVIKEESKGQVYLPFEQMPIRGVSLAVRTDGDPLQLAGAARSIVLNIDPEQPIFQVRTMEAMLGEFVAQPRFSMALLAVFAGLALVLAAVGIYGVISYSVAQRTHEIGVRMALGAQQGDVLGMVLRQGIVLAAIGLGAGVVIALVATRVLASLLYGVTATDPATFISITALLGAVAVVASLLPARRATRVDPIIALRYE